MIQNPQFLDTDFLPPSIQHRDSETNHLSTVLQSLSWNSPSQNAALYGPPGAGKTCTARQLVDRLQQQAPSTDTKYIDCWRNHRPKQFLQHVIDGIDTPTITHPNATSHAEYFQHVREHDRPYVVILDEVDQLDDSSLLPRLLDVPHVSVVLIANREETFLASVDESVSSTVRAAEKIHFDAYSDRELNSILEKRVDWGLTWNAITTDQLELIARKARGDARHAITTLRLAAKAAFDADMVEITDAVIATAACDARDVIRQKNISKLNRHQRILYDIISRERSVRAEELYREYRSEVDDPRVDRTLRDYLNKMCQYNLIRKDGSNRGRTYEVVESRAQETVA